MPSALQPSDTNSAWTDSGYSQFMGGCWGKGTADKSLTSPPSYPAQDMLNQSRMMQPADSEVRWPKASFSHNTHGGPGLKLWTEFVY